MAAPGKFWKPGDPKPPETSASTADAALDAKGNTLSSRTLTMRFMLRGQEAVSNKKAEQERIQKEAAARWIAKHGGDNAADLNTSAAASAPMSSSGAASTHTALPAGGALSSSAATVPSRPSGGLRIIRDMSTTCPYASSSSLYQTAHGAMWGGRRSFKAFNKGLEAVVAEAKKEKAAAPDADDTAMANFAARVQGRGAGDGPGKRAREGDDEDDHEDKGGTGGKKQHRGPGAEGKGKKGGQGLNMVVARKGGIGKRR